MLRVLHIVGGLNVGGVETWLAEGLPTIDRNLYQFDFLVHGDGAQFYRDKLEASGARVWQCPNPRNLTTYVRSFLRILRATHYDAIDAHTYCSSGLALALAARAQVPVRIFHSHTAQDESGAGIVRAVYFAVADPALCHAGRSRESRSGSPSFSEGLERSSHALVSRACGHRSLTFRGCCRS